MEKLYFIQKQVIQPMANFIVIEYSMKLQTWRGLYEIFNANNASTFLLIGTDAVSFSLK